MKCREGCGACCIAPSINESFWGMPAGKPAGVPCIHLTDSYACAIFDDHRRPEVCAKFSPEAAFCGVDRQDALVRIQQLEIISRPE